MESGICVGRRRRSWRRRQVGGGGKRVRNGRNRMDVTLVMGRHFCCCMRVKQLTYPEGPITAVGRHVIHGPGRLCSVWFGSVRLGCVPLRCVVVLLCRRGRLRNEDRESGIRLVAVARPRKVWASEWRRATSSVVCEPRLGCCRALLATSIASVACNATARNRQASRTSRTMDTTRQRTKLLASAPQLT